jgi:hypothetical protein
VAELNAAVTDAAAAVFRRQVEAFNVRDLEGFLATYASDAVVHGVTSNLPLRGLEELRSHYRERLADPQLHCEVLELFAWEDGWLVARERVTSSTGTLVVTAMFAIRDALIARAFIGF